MGGKGKQGEARGSKERNGEARGSRGRGTGRPPRLVCKVSYGEEEGGMEERMKEGMKEEMQEGMKCG